MRNSMKRLLLAAVLKPVHRWLAQCVNWTRGMTGRRWQRRFFSYPLDDRHTATAVRYVELSSYRWGVAGGAERAVNGGRAGCGSSSPEWEIGS
jgi:hypothetical protein